MKSCPSALHFASAELKADKAPAPSRDSSVTDVLGKAYGEAGRTCRFIVAMCLEIGGCVFIQESGSLAFFLA